MSCVLVEISRQRVNDGHGFYADADDLAYQPHDVFGIVFAIGVGGDAATFAGGDLVLVDDPVEGGAVAEAIMKSFGWDASECERGVHCEAEFVLGETHFVFDAIGEGKEGRFDKLQLPRLQLLIVEVHLGEFVAGFGEGVEFGGEGNPRQLALEVVGVLLPVAGMVQQAIDVVKDVPLVDLLVLVVLAELLQHPIGDVLAAVRAVFVVNVEREALRAAVCRV